MNIEELKGKFGDLLRPNLYEIIIEPPLKLKVSNMENVLDKLKILAHTTDFPFETITTSEYFAKSKKYMVATGVDYDPFSITYNLDAEGDLLDFYERWKRLIINDENKVGYFDDYKGKITINMLNRQNKKVYAEIIFYVYPVNRSNIALSYVALDSLSDLSISFVYLRAKYELKNASYDTNFIPSNKTFKYGGMNSIFSTPDNIQKKGYAGSISDGFSSGNVGGLGGLNVINKFKVPSINGMSDNFSKVVNDKLKDYQSTIQTSIDSKVNEIQNNINKKYKDLQKRTIGRLQSSISDSLSKLFRF